MGPQVGVRGIGGFGRLAGKSPKSHQQRLREWLAKDVENCRVGTLNRGPLGVSINATGSEIVDVTVLAPLLPATAKGCIEERAWDILLDLSFVRDTIYTVRFP